MSFRKPQHPSEVRTALQTGYDRYVSGVDLFPRVRWNASVDTLPRKTQAVAKVLEVAWRIIDEDNAYFDDAIALTAELAMTETANGKTEGGYSVITRIGRNCVKMAHVELTEGRPQAVVGQFRTEEVMDKLEGHEFNIRDGRRILVANGGIQFTAENGPDLVVVRESNVSLIYVPNPPEQQADIVDEPTPPEPRVDTVATGAYL